MTKDFCGFVKYGKSAVLWSLNSSQLLGVQVHSRHYEAEEKTRYSSTAQRNTYHSLTDKNMKRVFLWHAFKLDVTDWCHLFCFRANHTPSTPSSCTHTGEGHTVHHGILLFIACKGIDQEITMICKAPALSCKELCTTQFLPYCFLNLYFANMRVLSLLLLHILPRNFILDFQSAI